MKTFLLSLTGVLLSLAVVGQPRPMRPDNQFDQRQEQHLGSVYVGPQRRPYVTQVGSRNQLAGDAISIRLTSGQAHVLNVTVSFCNGTDQSFFIGQPNVGRVFATPGEMSRPLEFVGGTRCIRQVTLFANAIAAGRPDRRRPPVTEATFDIQMYTSYAEVEMAIGSTGLSIQGSRKFVDTADVCGVTHVKVRVDNKDAHIDDIAVRFRNGEVDQLPVRSYFRHGTETQWFPLRGRRERCITGFYVTGQSETFPINRKASVTLIGYIGR